MVEGTGRVVSVGPPVGAYVRLRDGAGSEVRCARYKVCRWAINSVVVDRQIRTCPPGQRRCQESSAESTARPKADLWWHTNPRYPVPSVFVAACSSGRLRCPCTLSPPPPLVARGSYHGVVSGLYLLSVTERTMLVLLLG